MTDRKEEKKRKIKLFEVHFAWVNESLLQTFVRVTNIQKRTHWIKTCVEEDFNIVLEKPDDLPKLDMIVRSLHYEDKGEWLRERMRNEIKKQKYPK